MAEELSKGQILLHNKKLVQASCFLGSSIPMEKRIEWSASFTKPRLRADQTKLKDTSIFLVLSQNCDIACRKDQIESTIEIAVCKKIKPKDVYEGNSFVKSVRKLHFQAQENWYEANVDYILHVDKSELLEVMEEAGEFPLISLSDEYAKSVPVWRSNRYMRSALPDNFNAQIEPIFGDHIAKIESSAIAEEAKDFSSYIRAFYVWVDSSEEKEHYAFDFFALLRDDISDEQASQVQDAIEEMAEAFAEVSGYEDLCEIYSGRESTTTVAYLTKFVRFNFDHLSLEQGDGDTGPEQI
ncbi:hypothetical protein OL318_003993 [Vibrio parahaemolyticus]|uniref:hypothetical protein n=1 Tax=Vibrio parahaemolyticus TaxID=670 RepID=UPI00186A346D|nr:hypothetical protein [Vibrio parahaemolyticus]EKA7393679.1 hypothetical protein [Vibrio parahaemolyticus]MBE4214189.1 hypothetical protein [Vibrio parahaemolyticus]MCR9980216.1 hypothetical protein [Vibrio parahaemolyticus]HAS6779758.1 hypothetical protein [Vibrio parahaemolyticus]HAS6992145.1 hypothetical protein [Vibrio parahaemolyticus]